MNADVTVIRAVFPKLRLDKNRASPRKAGGKVKTPKISEYDLHRQFAMFLRHALAGNAMFFHVPNGGKRSASEGGRFKAMAVVPGVPDLVILDGGRAHFLEIKAQGGRLSDNQIACHKALGRAGCPVAVVRNLEEVIAALLSWGVPLKPASLPL